MFRFSKDYKLENITVKINNRKRRYYSDSPMSHRSRHSSIHTNHGSSDDRRLSKYVHRRSRTPTSLRKEYRRSKHEKYARSKDSDKFDRTYKVLCVSNLYPKASDRQIKEILYQKYRKFGEFSVEISYGQSERLAYVCFRSSNDARDAKHSKNVINIFDNICLVEPVYKSHSSRDHHESKTRHSQSRNVSTNFTRYYPSFTEIHGSFPTDRFYETLPYDALPIMRSPLAFREIGLPPPYPYEFMVPQQPLLNHLTPNHPQLEQIRSLYEPQRHHQPSFKPYPRSHLMQDKKDKFPYYLEHTLPEDDSSATRTLFVGNLDISIKHDELQCLFDKFGVIEDIDVKRPLVGTGNSYAFIRYQNLDMAYNAKVELSGQYIGKYQCKIGYGKPVPTQQIWVGGLDPCTSFADLEREFDRFGLMLKIKYVEGDTCAQILYENIDAANAAVEYMRGDAIKGSKHRLRVDYVNEDLSEDPILTRQDDSDGSLQTLTKQDEYPSGGSIDYNTICSYKTYSVDCHKNSSSLKQHSVSKISSPRSPLYQSTDSDVTVKKEVIQSVRSLDSVSTQDNLALKSNDIWHGSFIFKNCQFPTSCHLTSANINILEKTMKNKDCK